MKENEPENAAEWNALGLALSNSDSFEEALRCFDRAIELKSEYVEALGNRAATLHLMRRFAEALSAYERTVNVSPLMAEYWFAKAEAERSLGRAAKAVVSYQFVAALARDGRVDLLAHAKQAVKELTAKGVKSFPDAVYEMLIAGFVLCGQMKLEEALALFEKAVKLSPFLALAWQYKGKCCYGLKRLNDAVRCYEKAIELDSSNAVNWFCKGMLAGGLGRHHDAKIAYSRAVEIDPSDAEARVNLGRTLAVMDKPDEAVSCFTKATVLSPCSWYSWFGRALSEDDLGRRQDAFNSYKKVLEFIPPAQVKELEYAKNRISEIQSNPATLNQAGQGHLNYERSANHAPAKAQVPSAVETRFTSGKGEFIGQKYEVYRTLGKGGFGVVYLAYSHETKSVYALKTFRDDYFFDDQTRGLFRKEAQLLIDLEPHPFLVEDYFVEEVSGRLYIVMEYVAPDEAGLNTLEGYLERRPPDLAQSLRWGIQFCLGMEFVYSQGIKCHRDIKPANIMITQDKMLKISDFGLAGIITAIQEITKVKAASAAPIASGAIGQTMRGASFGTPTHMPPEQFVNAADCDERSDIYAFGVVLYQMAASGKAPFLAAAPRDSSPYEFDRFWNGMYSLHATAPVPALDTPLMPVIKRCLEKAPDRRYHTFASLRTDLEALLLNETGEILLAPERDETNAGEWVNKGLSLKNLGRIEEAIACYDKAIGLNASGATASVAWSNKGNCHTTTGSFASAVECYDSALAIDAKNEKAWCGKGYALHYMGRFKEAVDCYDKAIGCEAAFALAWSNKAYTYLALKEYEKVWLCADTALKHDPRLEAAWVNKGAAYQAMGRPHDAAVCYASALEINPRDQTVFYNSGLCFNELKRYQEAIGRFNKAIEENPKHAYAWCNKGNSYIALKNFAEAQRCLDKAIEIDPRYATPWRYKGYVALNLKNANDALTCFTNFLRLIPAGSTSAAIEDAKARIKALGGSF